MRKVSEDQAIFLGGLVFCAISTGLIIYGVGKFVRWIVP